MKLMTAAIKNKLPKLNATDGDPDARCIVKYFDPTGSWSWFAFEFDGEDTFFGFVKGFENEWGYFSLAELESVRGFMNLGVERDLYYDGETKKELDSKTFA